MKKSNILKVFMFILILIGVFELLYLLRISDYIYLT